MRTAMRGALATVGLVVLAACGDGSAPAEMRDRPGARGPQEVQGAEGMQGMEGMAGMAGMEGGRIRVSARQVALAGVTFAVAKEAPLERTVRAVSMAVADERGLGIVNARVGGWVERLYVEETGSHVRVGQPLLELYSPDLVTAQEELLLARRLGDLAEGEALAEAARRQLRLWNISDDQIAALERSGEVRRTLTIRSDFAGHVLEKSVVEGQMIRPGDPLFRIADLSVIWIEPAIFEADIPLVRVGQLAEVTFDALPGRRFRGHVTFIQPELEMRTRTLRVRVELPNPGLLIRPMMYGAVEIEAEGPRGVTVPLGAVLPTGERDLAFVVREGGVVPAEVTVAARGDSALLVAGGLAPGDTVVASSAFLFDSESQLAAAMAGIMLNMGMGLDMGGMPAGEMEGMAADEETDGLDGMPMPGSGGGEP